MSAIDPYKTLGVRRNATSATITRAFRRRSMETHPDRGGDQATFQAVTLAYRVLSDPARRTRYDSTGEIDADKPDNRHAARLGILVQCFMAVMSELLKHGKSPKHEDIVRHMKGGFEQILQQFAEKKKRFREGVKFMEEAAKRFVLTADAAPADSGSPENLMRDAINAQRATFEQQLKNLEDEETAHKEARDMLKWYRFDCEPERAVGGWDSATATATYQWVTMSG